MRVLFFTAAVVAAIMATEASAVKLDDYAQINVFEGSMTDSAKKNSDAGKVPPAAPKKSQNDEKMT